jgi:hypothetical protein
MLLQTLQLQQPPTSSLASRDRRSAPPLIIYIYIFQHIYIYIYICWNIEKYWNNANMATSDKRTREKQHIWLGAQPQ